MGKVYPQHKGQQVPKTNLLFPCGGGLVPKGHEGKHSTNPKKTQEAG